MEDLVAQTHPLYPDKGGPTSTTTFSGPLDHGSNSNNTDKVFATQDSPQFCSLTSQTSAEDDDLRLTVDRLNSLKREKRIEVALKQHSDLRKQLSLKEKRKQRAGEHSVLSDEIEEALQQLEDMMLPNMRCPTDCRNLFIKCKEAMSNQLINQYESFNRKNSSLELQLHEAKQEILSLKEDLRQSCLFPVDGGTSAPIDCPMPSNSLCCESRRIRTRNSPSEFHQRRKIYGDICDAPTESSLNTACMLHPPAFSRIGLSPKVRSVNGHVTMFQSLSITLNLIIEALAFQTRAQQVRLFFKDEKDNYVLSGAFPRKRENYECAPSFDDVDRKHRRLGRTIMTCAARNIAIVGVHEGTFDSNLSISSAKEKKTTHTVSSSMDQTEKKPIVDIFLGKGRADDDDVNMCKKYLRTSQNEKVTTDNITQAEKVYSYLCWPVRSPNSPSESKGVLELVNKVNTVEDPDQTHQHNFTAEDETAVHLVSRIIGVLLSRYPIIDDRVFLESSSSCGRKSNILSIIDDFRHSAGFDASQAVFEKYSEEINDVETIMNKALLSDIDLPVFRGPIHTMRSRIGRLGDDSHDGISEYHIVPPSQLTLVDYTLEAMRSMWLDGYEENKTMHEKCRYWSNRVKSLFDITKRFSEAVSKARQMKSLEDVQIFLQTLDFFVRSENSKSFLSTLAEAGECPTITAKEMLAADRITTIDNEPMNVRTYTIDVSKKRQQQRDIQKLSDDVEKSVLGNFLAQQPPRHQRMTYTAEARSPRINFQSNRAELKLLDKSSDVQRTMFKLTKPTSTSS